MVFLQPKKQNPGAKKFFLVQKESDLGFFSRTQDSSKACTRATSKAERTKRQKTDLVLGVATRGLSLSQRPDTSLRVQSVAGIPFVRVQKDFIFKVRFMFYRKGTVPSLLKGPSACRWISSCTPGPDSSSETLPPASPPGSAALLQDKKLGQH